MSLRARPIWYEGQLLRPQHLQQLLRWQEALLERRFMGLLGTAWGVHGLKLDETQLPLGRVALERVQAVLPDGTPVLAPSEDALPAPRVIPPEAAGQRILLAVPARAGDGSEDLRYEARSQPARDSTGKAPEAELPVGLPRFSLRLESEVLDDLVTLPILRIARVEVTGAVVLDDGFIPPALRLGAHPALAGFAREIAGTVGQRAEALAGRVDPSRAGADVSGMITFALLQLLNGHEPVFAQLAIRPDAAPEALHAAATRLAAELATFTRVERRPTGLPVWQHADPGPPLATLVSNIRMALASLAIESAVSLSLVERAPGVWVSPISDRALLQGASFVLAVRADMDPERLRVAVPPQAKIGPVEMIRDLVNLQLPGIALRPMPVAPREVPFRTGTVYLELDRKSDLWPRLDTSAAFALHLGTEFPGLTLEFWAIRGN